MSEENIAAEAAEQIPAGETSAIPADTAETPAPAAEPAAAEQIQEQAATQEQLPPPPAEIPAPAEASAENAEIDAAKRSIKVTVEPQKPQPRKRVKFNPNDAQAKKAWVAMKHQEQQDELLKNGYSPTAVVAMLRYMAQNHGYEQKSAKDHLVFTFNRLARSIKYSIDIFDQNMSSMLAIMVIDINGHLSDRQDLLRLPADESKQYAIDVIDHVWKASGGNSMGPDMQRLKEYVKRALNMKFAEGYAARAKYWCECVIDITMKTIDPFAGLFHTERQEIPDEIKKIMHIPEKKVYPPKLCPKCNQPMKWIHSIHKHICTNNMCEDWRPPREKKPRGEGGDQPRRSGKPWTSGKNIATRSGADRFKQRYAKKDPNRVIASAAPTEAVALLRPDGSTVMRKAPKKFETASGTWDALSKIKIPENPLKIPENPQPTATAPENPPENPPTAFTPGNLPDGSVEQA